MGCPSNAYEDLAKHRTRTSLVSAQNPEIDGHDIDSDDSMIQWTTGNSPNWKNPSYPYIIKPKIGVITSINSVSNLKKQKGNSLWSFWDGWPSSRGWQGDGLNHLVHWYSLYTLEVKVDCLLNGFSKKNTLVGDLWSTIPGDCFFNGWLNFQGIPFPLEALCHGGNEFHLWVKVYHHPTGTIFEKVATSSGVFHLMKHPNYNRFIKRWLIT